MGPVDESGKDAAPAAAQPVKSEIESAAAASECQTNASAHIEAESIDRARHRKLADDRIKTRLRERVDASIEKGVFGCPTFIVDGEMFWGADRLDQVERWIATGGW